MAPHTRRHAVPPWPRLAGDRKGAEKHVQRVGHLAPVVDGPLLLLLLLILVLLPRPTLVVAASRRQHSDGGGTQQPPPLWWLSLSSRNGVVCSCRRHLRWRTRAGPRRRRAPATPRPQRPPGRRARATQPAPALCGALSCRVDQPVGSRLCTGAPGPPWASAPWSTGTCPGTTNDCGLRASRLRIGSLTTGRMPREVAVAPRSSVNSDCRLAEPPGVIAALPQPRDDDNAGIPSSPAIAVLSGRRGGAAL
jgi:hypothetical protein